MFDIENLPILNTTQNIYTALMYKSEHIEDYKQCYLLFDNDHYHCITNPKGFLATYYYCPKCCSCFSHKTALNKHCCSDSTDINKPKHKEENDNRISKDMPHYLSRGICKGSSEEIKRKIETTKKPDEEAIKQVINNPRYINYDFETDTSSGVHKPNLCIAQVLNVDDDHDYEKSLSETKIFEGYSCCKDFCDWLFTKESANSTVMAHNQAGYDGKFILSYCIKSCLVPSKYIQQGNRISYMYFKKFNLRFIDSLSFFLCPLAKLSDTFEIDTIKGHFPHKFNTAENRNYIGKMPGEEMFFASNMKPESYKEFKEWYDKTDKTNWNFKDEFIKYCEADVVLLSKAVLKFRRLFVEDSILNIDPFRHTTLASLCMAIYTNRFLPEKTIS